MIGLLSDSRGDLDALEAGYALLAERGVRRFYFLGGRYADVEAWLARRSSQARGGRAYSDSDFLSDVSAWLTTNTETRRPGAFEEDGVHSDGEAQVQAMRARFSTTPERDCLQYLDGSVPRKLMEMVGTTLCCIVHNKNDLNRDDLTNASLFIHGASREPAVVQIGPRFFITPGALAGAAEQTCGLIDTQDGVARFIGLRLDGTVVVEPTDLVASRRIPGVKLTVR